MASHLIREQRADKTGKIVTRHVLAAPKKSAQRSSMPAPYLGKKTVKPGTTASGFKLRPKQLEQTRRTGVSQPCSPELERTGITGGNSHYFAFTASDAEVYEVLGAVRKWGDALKLINEGVRTAEEARTYLSKHKLGYLGDNRSELVDEALRRNVSPDDFIARIDAFSTDDHEVSNRIDSVRFASGPLLEGNPEIARDIAEGKISYEDLRTIGLAKLKPWGRIKALKPMLYKLQEGTDEYTVDDIKELVGNVSAQRLEPHYLDGVVDLIQVAGYQIVKETPNLHRCSTALNVAQRDATNRRIKSDDVAAAAVYSIKITNGVSQPGSDSVYVTEEYFRAGIPVDIAIRTFQENGDLESAKRMHDAINGNGINTNLADGWL